MFKSTALILVASLAAAAADIAWAQPETPATFVAPSFAAGELERLLPLAGDADGLAQTTDAGAVAVKETTRNVGSRPATQKRVRKEYPNVMGMSLTTWMKSRAL